MTRDNFIEFIGTGDSFQFDVGQPESGCDISPQFKSQTMETFDFLDIKEFGIVMMALNIMKLVTLVPHSKRWHKKIRDEKLKFGFSSLISLKRTNYITVL